MSELNITIDGGTSKRLKTAGKFCDKDILVTATGGSSGDSKEFARSIINKSITAYVDNDITTIGGYSFVDCAVMKSVSVPSATSIGNYAFSSCDVLSDVNIPKVTTLGTYVFNADTALTNIEGAEVTTLGNYAFTGCSGLTNVNFPKLKTINQYAFQNCTALTEYDGGEVTTIGTYAFTGCTALSSVSFPKATSIAAYAFNGTSALKHVSFPALKSMTTGAFRGSRFTSCDMPIVTNIANSGFRGAYLTSVTFPKVASSSTDGMRGCTALTYVDLPVCTSLAAGTFNGCTSLETLILRTTSKVCSLANVSAFTSTPIASGTGYVYVPSSLVNSYKTATNWKTYANQIRPLESLGAIYTIEGTTDGNYYNNGSPDILGYFRNSVVNSITFTNSTGTDITIGSSYDYTDYTEHLTVNGVSDNGGAIYLGTSPVYVSAINVTLNSSYIASAEHYGYNLEETIEGIKATVQASLPNLFALTPVATGGWSSGADLSNKVITLNEWYTDPSNGVTTGIWDDLYQIVNNAGQGGGSVTVRVLSEYPTTCAFNFYYDYSDGCHTIDLNGDCSGTIAVWDAWSLASNYTPFNISEGVAVSGVEVEIGGTYLNIEDEIYDWLNKYLPLS